MSIQQLQNLNPVTYFGGNNIIYSGNSNGITGVTSLQLFQLPTVSNTQYHLTFFCNRYTTAGTDIGKGSQQSTQWRAINNAGTVTVIGSASYVNQNSVDSPLVAGQTITVDSTLTTALDFTITNLVSGDTANISWYVSIWI